MKRKILLATILSLFIAVPAFAGVVVYSLHATPYPVLVNGVKLNTNLPVMTYKANGGDNAYVPLKAVLDATGAKTSWDGKKVNVTVGPDPAKVADSVVEIYVSKNGRDVEQGSGVLIDYDEILTCSHVTDKGDAYRIIYNDGHTTTAKLVKDKPSMDVAILEPAEKDVKPVKIGDSEEIQASDGVYVISSPKEKKNVMTQGYALGFSTYNGLSVIDSTATSTSGGSGGGLFNHQGELVGILDAAVGTRGEPGQTLSIPINDIRRTLSN